MVSTAQEPRKVFECHHCGNKTSMEAVASYEDELLEYEGQQPVGASYTRWTTYLCPVCHKATIEERSWDTFDVDYDGNPSVYVRVVYPETPFGRSGNVPESVANAFAIALKAQHLDGALCVVALRRTLDVICKDKGKTGDDLHANLKALAEEGVLPPILDKMAYVLRKMGNAAVHGDDEVFSITLIRSLIEFTETILSYVYTLPEKLAGIQERVDKGSSKT